MTLRTVCLGNAKPKAYINNPPPHPKSTIKELRGLAEKLAVDVSRCVKAGDEVRAGNGAVLYTATDDHERSALVEAISAPVEVPYEGPKCCTTIKFSPDSTLAQCVSEASTIWKIHGNGAPGWIAGNNAALVAVLAEAFGITEVRTLEIAE